MTQVTEAVIIGGGLTGLTLAYYLKKEGVGVTVLERDDRPGGVIRTHREQGFTYEAGPNTGVLGNLVVMQLFEELRGGCELEVANPQAKRRLIWKDGRWHSLPSGLVEAVQTPLFSLGDKLRLLGEPFRPKGRNPIESVGDLVKRRMGKSFLDYAVDPFISGIYAGDPDRLITQYALPKLYRLEQTYGSFIGGAFKKKLRDKGPAPSREVFSVRGGLENLVNALVQEIGAGNIHTGCQITHVEPMKGSQDGKARADGHNGQMEPFDGGGAGNIQCGCQITHVEPMKGSQDGNARADGQNGQMEPHDISGTGHFDGGDQIGHEGSMDRGGAGGFIVRYNAGGRDRLLHTPLLISTVGAHALDQLFPFIVEEERNLISSLEYARVVQVVLGFDPWEGLNLKAFGGLVPSRENRRILGVLFPSSFLSGRAPAGGALLNVFLGGIRHPQYHDMPDNEILETVKQEITHMFCLPHWQPKLVKIFRYRHAIPQYTESAGARIKVIEKIQKRYPGLILAGNIHEGIGMADRVAQAVRIAQEVTKT